MIVSCTSGRKIGQRDEAGECPAAWRQEHWRNKKAQARRTMTAGKPARGKEITIGSDPRGGPERTVERPASWAFQE
jgi:hypothetical protein